MIIRDGTYRFRSKKGIEMKVAIFSRFNGLNTGDEYLGSALRKVIDEIDDIESTIFDILLQKRKRFSIDEVPVHGQNKGSRPILSNKLLYILRVARVIVMAPKYYKIVKKNEVIVIAGGQLIVESPGNVCIFSIYLLSLLSRLTGRKFIVNSIGVSIRSAPYFYMVSRIIKNSYYFSVRDTISQEVVNSISRSVRIPVDFDLGLAASTLFPSANNRESEYFGVNVMDLYTRFNLGIESIQNSARNIQKVSKRMGLAPRLIVTSFGQDVLITNQLANELKRIGCRIEVVFIQDINEIAYAYSGLNFMISCRMHSALFAISYEIPTYIYEWDAKITGLIQDLSKNFPGTQLQIIPDIDFQGINNLELSSQPSEHYISRMVFQSTASRFEQILKE